MSSSGLQHTGLARTKSGVAVHSPRKKGLDLVILSKFIALPAAAVLLFLFLTVNHVLDPRKESSSGLRSYDYVVKTVESEAVSILAITDKKAKACASNSPLKVWVYPLKMKYTFALGATSCNSTDCYLNELDAEKVWDWSEPPPFLQEGLFRQHAIDWYLSADIMGPRSNKDPRTVAVRVDDPEEADVFFVPFFSSICLYIFRRRPNFLGPDFQFQKDVTEMLLASPHWRRKGGMDHVILAHHPLAYRYRKPKLANATFIVADFGLSNQSIASLAKDVVAPYVPMVKPLYHDEDAGVAWKNRSTLLYFQGTVTRDPEYGGYVRQELMDILSDVEGVIFQEGNPDASGFKKSTSAMRRSKFCLHLAGDTPSSCRLFDAIVSHCVPVIISDFVELPFEDTINYRKFSIFISTRDAVKPGRLVRLLRQVTRRQWTRMWKRLKAVQPHFRFQYPSRPGDAVNMVWENVRRVTRQRQLMQNRQNRLVVPDWMERTTAR